MIRKIAALFLFVGLFIGSALADTASIFQAVDSGNVQAVEEVISQADHLLEARNGAGDTPLLVAARKGNLEIVSFLLAAGADVTALNDSRRDILNIAITTRNPELAKQALEAGADATMVTSIYQGSALIYGSAKGQVEIIEMLIAANAPLDRINNIGWTALLEAVILGDGSPPYVEIVEMLLNAGADRHIADKNGLTPLDHARARGFADLSKLLVD
ncbi:ankyrin repeat domain-containing protein [Ruegeria sp.]|uniref:ankyrin repeat domain-containing protein n=1 Tax=Ruegeria sp. TaxID=1879320 RepID=UPI002323336C|nr:ankyrin repeat domain-containing protein [Ruegeria sp.]MDA7966033.1 ankyrin repeat domain-containing protein [Ruegeria sp.]